MQMNFHEARKAECVSRHVQAYKERLTSGCIALCFCVGYCRSVQTTVQKYMTFLAVYDLLKQV